MAVVFCITGVELEPGTVTAALGVEPDAVWRVGELKRPLGGDESGGASGSRHEASGWKKFAPESLRESLSDDFGYWLPFVAQNRSILAEFRAAGHSVSLDVLVDIDEYAFSPGDLRLLGEAGVELVVTNWGGSDARS